jgi:hypothetical protein
MLRRYRAHGADPPFADRRRAHGVAMEGYFWRFADPRSGWVLVALCGVCRDGAQTWGNVALAAHPGGVCHAADLPRAGADPDTLGVWAAGEAGSFRADARGVSLDLGPRARLEVAITDPWPPGRTALGGVGVAQLVPGLGQYWDPHLLGARVSGHAVLGEQTISLDGFTAYAEKNWGAGGFPRRWWWGQAAAFSRPELIVAFAGGELTLGPVTAEATGLVVRLGDRLIRLGNPVLAPVRAEVDGRRWWLRARGPRSSIELEGIAGAAAPIALPVPVPAERRSVPAAHQHFAGRLRIVLRHRGRVLYAGESPLAGLELGVIPRPPGEARAPRRSRRAPRSQRR